MISHFKITCLLLVVIESAACVHKHSNGVIIPSKECIELNNKGGEYLQKFPYSERDIDEAINLFKQAVICDTTYAIGYMNLANAYGRARRYSEKIMAFNKVLALTDNAAPILLEKGKVLEITSGIDSARKVYYLAKKGFEKRLFKNPNDVDIIKELILLKALMAGKEEAIKEIDEQIKLHPDLRERLSGLYERYKMFNRHAYIYHLPTEIQINN